MSSGQSVATGRGRPLNAIIQDLAGGSLTGIVAVTFAIAYAALMFAGPIAPYLATGLGITFTSTVLLVAIIGWRSSFPYAAGGPDSNSSVVIAVTGAALAAELPPEAAAAHFAAFILIATLLSATVLFIFGVFRLGRAVRFIPFPVVAGFMSTIGLLIAGSALGLCNGHPLHLGDWAGLAKALQNPRFLAGCGFAGSLFIATRRLKSPLTMPVSVVLGVVVTHLVLLAAGVSIAEGRQLGWLFPALGGISLPRPLAVITNPALDWKVMAGMIPYFAATVVAVVIGVLLNETGIEAATDREADIDHELRWHGIANAVAGLAGGSVGNITLSRTMLNYRCGARTRLSVVALVAIVLVFFAFGRFVGYLPPFILGGVLVSLGLTIAQEWLLRTRARLAPIDYALVVAIAAIGAIGGVSLAVGAGIVASCLLFAIACARIPVIRHDLRGGEHRSRLDRPLEQSQALLRAGGDVRILVLQGFIFFGTANALVDRIRGELGPARSGAAAALVLDFKRVTGLDSAAVLALVKVRQLVAAAGGTLVLVGLAPAQAQALKRGGMMQSNVRLFDDLDTALEWCEDRVLGSAAGAPEASAARFTAWLADGLETQEGAAAMLAYLKRRDLAAGDVLVHQGAAADSLILVESGRISVMGKTAGGEPVRLRGMLGCTVVGEIALYIGGERSATVVADTPVVVHELTQVALARMERQAPPLAIALHRMMARIEAERLRFTSHDLQALTP